MQHNLSLQLTDYRIEEQIAYVTLNRPEKRNAFSPDLVRELRLIFADIRNNDGVKVVVLRANGKVFSAGADLDYLKTLQKNTYDENLTDSLLLKDLYRKIYTLPKVVIAEVQGHAIAGGCGLVSVCDFAFSSPDSQFGYTEVKIGFIPALVMVFLTRKIGESATRQLLLSGDLITAEAAKNFGLISHIFPAEHLAAETEKFAKHLVKSNSANSMALTKTLLNSVQEMSVEEGLNLAAEMNAKVRASEDCIKGINAFLNKEPIAWT
jgi:methylglutaconyl-CoA hydratase